MMDMLQINIYLTNECNRFCKHCYYPHGSSVMSDEDIIYLSEWIGNFCRNHEVKTLKVHVLGGEPLKYKDKLFLLVSSIKSNIPDFTKPHPDGEFVVFTNGDYFSFYTLTHIKEHKIYILLNPSSDDLMTIHEKMHMVKSICGGISLAIVADEINLPRLPELTNLAIYHRGSMRINRLYDGGKDPEYIMEFGKQMHKVFDLLLASEYAIYPNFLLESTYPLWTGVKNPYSCGKRLLVIDPDGTIRSCNADMDTTIGHIKTHFYMSQFKFHQRWSAKNLPECQTCKWVTICQGGCPYTRKLAYGHYNQKTPFCEVFKTLFPKLEQLKYKYLRERQNVKSLYCWSINKTE